MFLRRHDRSRVFGPSGHGTSTCHPFDGSSQFGTEGPDLLGRSTLHRSSGQPGALDSALSAAADEPYRTWQTAQTDQKFTATPEEVPRPLPIAIPLNEHTAHGDVGNLVRLFSQHVVAAAFEPNELPVRGGESTKLIH